MANNKPFVAIACLCEKVLREPDGALSLIRIVDQFTVAVPPDVPEEFKPHISMQLVVALRGFGLIGKYDIVLKVYGPTKASSPAKMPVEFKVDAQAINIVTTIVLGIETFGQCRIDVEWEGEVLTSVPFTLVQGQARTDAPNVIQQQ